MSNNIIQIDKGKYTALLRRVLGMQPSENGVSELQTLGKIARNTGRSLEYGSISAQQAELEMENNLHPADSKAVPSTNEVNNKLLSGKEASVKGVSAKSKAVVVDVLKRGKLKIKTSKQLNEVLNANMSADGNGCNGSAAFYCIACCEERGLLYPFMWTDQEL